MKKFIVISAVIMGIIFSGSVFAQTKIAVLDPNRVIGQSQRGKAFLKELNAFAQQKDAEIKKKVEEFQKLEKEYRAKAPSLSEEKAMEMQKKLSDMQIEIKRMQDDAKREFQLRQTKGFDKFRKILKPIVDQIAKEKGIDIVFAIGQGGSIIYFSPAVDITDEVIKRFDAAK